MKKHLYLQISMALAVGTLLMMILSAWLVYNRSYAGMVTAVRKVTIELMETVAEPATIACYLNQEDMLKDVTSGLEKNSIVSNATLTTSQGLKITAGPTDVNSSNAIEMVLTSPFAGGKVGELVVVQNENLIEQRANQAGRTSVTILIAISLLIILFTALFIYFFLTRPIKQMAEELHKIVPGSHDRMQIPLQHRENEIGQLIKDTNQLLYRAEETINSERTLRQHVQELEAKYRKIFERACGAIFLTDPSGQVTMANNTFYSLRDSVTHARKKNNDLCRIFADQVLVREMLESAVKKRIPVSNDLLIHTKEGDKKWYHAVFLYNEGEEKEEGCIEGILYDITKRYEQEKKTKKVAEHDYLTHLYNRYGVERKLHQSLGRREHEDLTIFLMDLDGFKQINDTYGHDAGDIVLSKVARRLVQSSRSTDTVARWGGDEFLIIFYTGYNKDDCFAIGHKILENITRPIELGNGNIGKIGACIGVSTLQGNSFDKEQMLKSADQAMYKVKELGKNGVCFHNGKTGEMECKMYRP